MKIHAARRLGRKTVNSRTHLALVIVLICLWATVGVIASIKSTSQDENRGDCEQACTRTYQDCIGASNSNRAQCQRDMQACRGNCKKSSASPSPGVSPSMEPTATATRSEEHTSELQSH